MGAAIPLRIKPFGHLPDGTAYYAPLGELPVDTDEGRVQCHACGRWFRQLNHAHLRLHGMTAEEYRRAFGLRRRHPLQAPDLSELRSRTMKRLRVDDERVKSGMRTALELARSGRLVELRLAGNAETSLEATRIRRATAVAMGNARAEALRTERERRARELGYTSLRAYLEQAHTVDRRALADIGRELGISDGTVARELTRLGIPRIPLGESRAIGRRAWAAKHATGREERLRSLGYATLEQFVADSRRRGLTQNDMAAQLGVHVRTLRRVIVRMDADWASRR